MLTRGRTPLFGRVLAGRPVQFLTVRTLHSPGTWLFGLYCPQCVRPFAFPCDISWIWGRATALRARARGFFRSLFLLASLRARVRPPRAGTPAPALRTSFRIFDVLEVRLGMPTRFRALLSGALRRSCTVCCVPAACGAAGSAGSRTCMQLKLLCVCSTVYVQCAGSWLLGWHTECSLALLQRLRPTRCCAWLLLIILLHVSIRLRLRRIGHSAERFAAPEEVSLCLWVPSLARRCVARMRLGLWPSVCVFDWFHKHVPALRRWSPPSAFFARARRSFFVFSGAFVRSPRALVTTLGPRAFSLCF